MRRIGLLLFVVGCSRITSTNGNPDASIDTASGRDACVPSMEPPHVVYLHRNGGTYMEGFADDSRTNTSKLIPGTVTLPPASPGADEWISFVGCMRDTFAPFNATITEFDPGQYPHTELVVIDDATPIGLPPGTASIASYECDGTSGMFQMNGVPFLVWYALFPTQTCWIGAHVIGKTLGLDEVVACPDVMSASECSPVMDKTFTNIDAPCGDELGPRPCACGGTTQSSARLLHRRPGSTCN